MRQLAGIRDRKASLRKRIRFRQFMKAWALPILGVIIFLASYVAFGYAPLSALLSIAETFIALFGDPEPLLANDNRIRVIAEVGASVLVPLVLLRGVTALRIWSSVVNYVVPAPPTFVFDDLEVERAKVMSVLEVNVGPFVGRSEELLRLKELLKGSHGNWKPFRWQMLNGFSGVGKTRLAIEWLAAAKDQGWDIGIINIDEIQFLSSWHPRRPTAFVIDEARSSWREKLIPTMETLSDKGSSSLPIRLLLISQIPAFEIGSEPERLGAQRQAEALTIDELGGERVCELLAPLELTKEKGLRISELSSGNPRAALLLANVPEATSLKDAIDRWCFRLLPELADPEAEISPTTSIPLIASALAGPVRNNVLHRIEDRINPKLLSRFFARAHHAQLDEKVPKFEPSELGHSLCLKLLAKMRSEKSRAILIQIFREYPDASEEGLVELWQTASILQGSNELALHIQSTYDELYPDRARTALEGVEKLNREFVERNLELADLERLAQGAALAIMKRPFDFALVLEAIAVFTNISSLIHNTRDVRFDVVSDILANCFKEFEKVRQNREIGDKTEFLTAYAVFLSNLIQKCVEWRHEELLRSTFDIKELVRRFDQLLASSSSSSSSNLEIRVAEVQILVGTTLALGGEIEKNPDKVKEAFNYWLARLDRILGDEELRFDLRIRRCEAIAISNVAAGFGLSANSVDHQYFEDWARRFDAMYVSSGCANDKLIRQYEVIAASNAMLAYGRKLKSGETGAADDICRWLERIDSIRSASSFKHDVELAILEIVACENLSKGLIGSSSALAVQIIAELSKRIDNILENRRFSQSGEVRLHEAKVAVNAVYFFGAIGRAGDAAAFKNLESWGRRFDRILEVEEFANTPQIRFEEAKAVTNAISAYGQVTSSNFMVEVEKWGARLDPILRIPSCQMNAEIRGQEAAATRNAICCYGRFAMSGDKDALLQIERWACRFAEMSKNPELRMDLNIRQNEAISAAAAIQAYHQFGLLGDVSEQRWRSTLALALEEFRGDPEIAFVAGAVGVRPPDAGRPIHIQDRNPDANTNTVERQVWINS